MIILFNEASWKGYVWHPKDCKFKATHFSVTKYIEDQYNAKRLRFKDKKTLDVGRKILEKIPNIEKLSLEDLHDHVPEFFI